MLPLLASARCGCSPKEKRTRRKSGWTSYLCMIAHMSFDDICSGSIVRREYTDLGPKVRCSPCAVIAVELTLLSPGSSLEEVC